MTRFAWLALVAGCFNTPPAPAFRDGGPGGGDGGGGDGAIDGAPCVDPALGPITHVKSFCSSAGPGPQATCGPVAASAANNAVVVQIGCRQAGTLPPVFSFTAPGWGLSMLTSATFPGDGIWVATYVALAPDTNPVTFTANISTCVSAHDVTIIGDEFTNNDPCNAATTFDASAASSGGATMPSVQLTTASANETLWAAIKVNGAVTQGAMYTAGANSLGDITEYQVSTAAQNTVVTAPFACSGNCRTTIVGWAATMVAIKP